MTSSPPADDDVDKLARTLVWLVHRFPDAPAPCDRAQVEACARRIGTHMGPEVIADVAARLALVVGLNSREVALTGGTNDELAQAQHDLAESVLAELFTRAAEA